MKDNRKTMQVLVIITIIFTVMGGSLAYWNWSTNDAQKTSVTFTVEKTFSCAADGGGDVTSSNVFIVPTTCTDSEYIEEVKKANGGSLPADYIPRVIKREIKVTPTINKADLSIYMDLWLDINDLGDELSNSENFKYVLTTSDSSCSEGTIIAEGTFNGKSKGDKITLLDRKVYSATLTETYYLYIWLDYVEENNETMNQKFNFSLNGSCTDSPHSTNVLSERIVSLSGNGEIVANDKGKNEGYDVYAQIVSNTIYESNDRINWYSDTSKLPEFTESEVDKIENYELNFELRSSGNYKICAKPSEYQQSYVSLNGMKKYTFEYIYDSSVGPESSEDPVQYDCYDLGSLSKGDVLSINSEILYACTDLCTTLYYDGGIEFYLTESSTDSLVYFGSHDDDIDYHYQGANPNNYVTFNNETWRIVGAMNGSYIGLENGKYYTKIVRNVGVDSATYNSFYDNGLITSAKELMVIGRTYYENGQYEIIESTDNNVQLITLEDFSNMGTTKWFPPIGLARVLDVSGGEYPVYVVHKTSAICYLDENYNVSDNCGYYTEECGEESCWDEYNSLEVSSANVFYYPVVYLDSDIIITDGDGSSGNPFKVSK